MPCADVNGVIDNNAKLGHRSIMSSTATPVSPSALFRQGSFVCFLLSRSLSRFSSQIAAVAIGWQVYDLTASAFLLGMVGLVQFLPTALLVLVAGHAADRYQRKRVVQLCQLAEALTALFLALGAYAGWLTVGQIFIATAILGTTGAFESPATAALLPLIAPQGSLQRATALSSGATQVATIAGPALGGFAYAISPGLPYAIMVLFWLLGALFTGAIRVTQSAVEKDSATSSDLFAGVLSAKIPPSSAPSRSIFLLCCSAASRRCCRSMRATSLRPVRSASVSCVPRLRSARC